MTCVRDTRNLLWPDGSNGARGAPLKQHHRAQQTQAYRYPLYSESKRKSLATELLASTKGCSAANLIARVDDYCVHHNDQRLTDGYQAGPFGVFGTRHTSSSTATLSGNKYTGTDFDDPGSILARLICPPGVTLERSTCEDDAVAIPSQNSATGASATLAGLDTVDRTVDWDALASPLDDPPSNESVEEVEDVRHGDSPLETALVQSSSEHDFWQMNDPFSSMNDLNMPLELPTGDVMRMDILDSTSFTFDTEGFTGLLDNIGAARKSPTPPSATYASILADAPLLLRYYQNESDVSRPAKQSFWRSFVLPSAMHTFAELTVFGQATDLSSSVFYSTIANSAFAMQHSDSVHSGTSHWHTIGSNAEGAARQYLQKALQLPQPDCKQLLTATLSLGLVSVSRAVGCC